MKQFEDMELLKLTVRKSDHPFVNSRYLLHEAQQAYFYGLAPNLAIASVTTAPAEMLGMDHRIGYIREGIPNPHAPSLFVVLTTAHRIRRW